MKCRDMKVKGTYIRRSHVRLYVFIIGFTMNVIRPHSCDYLTINSRPLQNERALLIIRAGEDRSMLVS